MDNAILEKGKVEGASFKPVDEPIDPGMKKVGKGSSIATFEHPSRIRVNRWG